MDRPNIPYQRKCPYCGHNVDNVKNIDLDNESYPGKKAELSLAFLCECGASFFQIFREHHLEDHDGQEITICIT